MLMDDPPNASKEAMIDKNRAWIDLDGKEGSGGLLYLAGCRR